MLASEFCKTHTACEEAREWVGNRTAADAANAEERQWQANMIRRVVGRNPFKENNNGRD